MKNELMTVTDIERMAVAVAKSNLFGVRTPDQAMALMLISQAEGMHPAIAARDYHVINGKPTLKADAMLARFQQAGGTVKWSEYTDTAVCAVVSHPAGGSVEITWTIAMAEKAGLTKNPTWRQYPRQMLRARVISEGIRTVFPGVAVGVYTPEEAADFDKQPPAPAAAAPETQPMTIDLGPADVVEQSPDQAEADAAELSTKIAKATSIQDLDNLRPAIRQLPEDLRKIAMAKARAQAAVIRETEADEQAL
jgi:hypothetical protein